MKAQQAKEILYEISYFLGKKKEINTIIDALQDNLSSDFHAPSVDIHNDTKKLLLHQKDELIDKFESLSLILPDTFNKDINKLMTNLEKARADITAFVKEPYRNGEYKALTTLLEATKNDLGSLVEAHITSRSDIATPRQLTNIEHKLKIENGIIIFERNSLQLYRRLWHMFGGFSVAFSYWYSGMSKDYALILLGLVTIATFTIDSLRLVFNKLNDRVLRDFRLLIREDEKNSLSAMTYYLVGSWLSIFLFPKFIATLAIFFLAFADPIASIVGIKYGRKKWKWGKTYEGSIAAFITCFFLSFIFLLGLFEDSLVKTLLFSTAFGLAGTFAETFPLKIDDNLAIPVISGTIMWLFFYFI